MSAVLQKAKADLVSRPMISLLIVVTVATSSTLLTLALSTLMNLDAPYDRALHDLNGAHVWVYLDPALVGQQDVERIASLPGIVESTGLRHHVSTIAELRENRVAVSLRALPREMPEVNRLLIEEGRYLTPNQNELLASTDLDDLYKLSVGETLGVAGADGEEVDLPVIGLAYNPLWDTYHTDQPPYVYVSEETLRELYPDESSWGWSIGLRLADPQAVERVVKHIGSAVHDSAVDSYTDWRDVKEAAVFGARMNFIFLGAFGFFAILATVLVVASSIGSIVLSQFKQIGILKALGFTRHQILGLYLTEYLVLSLIGSPIGLATGIALSPLPLRSVAASLNTTFRPSLDPLLIGLVLSIVPSVVVAATLVAAYRGAQANIIKSIAVGAEAPRERPSGSIQLIPHLGLPLVLAMGLNDLCARPLRSLMTGVNLTLGVIGVVFGLTLNDTLDAYRAQPALMGFVHDAMVTRRSTSDDRTRHLLNHADGIEAFYSEALLDATSPQGRSFRVRAVEGDLHAFPFRMQEGRFFQPNTYEAIAGKGLLDWLELEIGDQLAIAFKENPNRRITCEIVGQYPEPTNEGEVLMVSLPTVSRWAGPVAPESYFLKLMDDCDVGELKRYLKDNSADDLNVTLIQQAIPNDVVYLQTAIFALAAILIGIALINVFNTSLLAMQEKTRDIGILKTLGMTPAQVLTMANASAGFLGLFAALVGIPLGFVLTKGMLASLAQTYGFGSVHVALNAHYIALMIPLAMLVSVAGSILPGRQAARLSIVSVLRRE